VTFEVKQGKAQEVYEELKALLEAQGEQFKNGFSLIQDGSSRISACIDFSEFYEFVVRKILRPHARLCEKMQNELKID
jgi:hypothetical protein